MATIFLVAVDGSEGSKRAVRFAAERARAEGARLHLLHVVDWSPYEVLTPRELETRHVEREREVERARRDTLEPLAKELTGLEVTTDVRHGHVTETVGEVVKELGVTQVFSGRRGRSKVKSMLFGSVTAGLVQTCAVPFTVVP